MKQTTRHEEKDCDESLTSLPIDRLQEYGVNAADINKLKSAGICTVKGLLMVTRKELLNIKGISDVKLDKMIEAAQKLESLGFYKATDIMNKRTKIRRISTGSRNLDNLLGGGIESLSITEVFGEFRSGKTQLSHTLAVTAQLQTEGNSGGKVAFIDTENTFRPERIKEIAEKYDLDPEQTLDNIIVARAYTTDHLNQLLMFAAGKMFEEEYAILIVDSIMAPFRVDFSGRGELCERQQILGKTLSRLMKISEQFNVAVYVTNQVMSDPSGATTFVIDAKKPIGGNIMAHASTTRLFMRKGKGDQRVIKIYDSPMLPESECTIQLTLGGVSDPSD